jgi:hypothetical protein
MNFGYNSRSELAVPIKDNQGVVVGVINLECKDAHVFTEAHQLLIELFARHIAIAIQKNNLLHESELQKTRLKKLQSSVQETLRVAPDSILRDAVFHTCAALDAKAVILVLAGIFADETPEYSTGAGFLHVSDRDEQIIAAPIEYMHSLDRTKFVASDSISRKVYESGLAHKVLNIDGPGYSPYKQPDAYVCEGAALCLPLTFNQKKIGIIWIYFTEPLIEDEMDLTIGDVQPYIKQVTFAYIRENEAGDLRRELQKTVSGFTSQIEGHYENVKRASIVYFWIAAATSIVGIILFLAGVGFLWLEGLDEGEAAIVSTVVGLLVQVASAFIFSRADAANKRMDEYHRELYNIKQFEILVSASDKITDEDGIRVKDAIISAAAKGWLDSAEKYE